MVQGVSVSASYTDNWTIMTNSRIMHGVQHLILATDKYPGNPEAAPYYKIEVQSDSDILMIIQTEAESLSK